MCNEYSEYELESMRFDQVESEATPRKVSIKQAMEEMFYDNRELLEGVVKIAFDAYWDNQIATMEM